jgi:hypothetical protein
MTPCINFKRSFSVTFNNTRYTNMHCIICGDNCKFDGYKGEIAHLRIEIGETCQKLGRLRTHSILGSQIGYIRESRPTGDWMYICNCGRKMGTFLSDKCNMGDKESIGEEIKKMEQRLNELVLHFEHKKMTLMIT